MDVLVIGGGITGAGVALDAAARGLRVALVERGDLAEGTSSRSSKLVHGGLRYLAKGHLGLVRESVAEREILRRLAPHLVRPLRFVIPAGGRRDARLLGIGLAAYDALAVPHVAGRHRRLSRAALAELAPGLTEPLAAHGWSYGDCATDDVRLTLAVARAARRFGADVVTRAEAVELRRAGGRVVGAVVRDRLGGAELEVDARVVVAATGVWAGRLAAPVHLAPAKGVHLVLPAAGLPTSCAVVVPADDGRNLFVVPFDERQVYVGTTDAPSDEPLCAPTVTAADAAYCLSAVNAAFGTTLSASDAVGAWAGFRPLPAAAAADPSHPRSDTEALSRRHLVVEDPPGLVTVTGGKLTTYRRMAADVVDAIAPSLGVDRRCPTAGVGLGLRGGAVGPAVAVVGDLCDRVGIARDAAAGLVARHGDHAAEVVLLAAETGEIDPLVEGLPYLAVEARWAAEREGAVSVADVLVRRLPVALRAADAGASAVPRVAALLGDGADADGYLRTVARERGVVGLRAADVRT